MSAKPRLIVFSPMPPARNGIADYCDEQLPLLASEWQITVVVDNSHPGSLSHALPDVELITLSQYLWRGGRHSADPHLYHVGNNSGHVYMLPVVLKRPGIVVLHDLTLHHLVDCATVRWGDFDRYSQVLEVEHGAAGAEIARQARKNHFREKALFYEMPLIKLLAAQSLAVIVHSEFARLKLLAQWPLATVSVVPHHVSPKVAPTLECVPSAHARKHVGVRRGELLIVSLGFIARAKQIDKILEALAAIRGRLPRFRYVLAGQANQSEYDVQADIERLGLQDVVHVTGYLSEEEFFVYARAADLILNLRYPSGGETSGTLIRSLALGAPVAVIDAGPFSELPSDAVVKLPWRSTFTADLAATLLSLCTDPSAREQLRLRAREWVERTHTIDHTTAMYSRVISGAKQGSATVWAAATPMRFPAISESARLWQDAQTGGARRFPLWFRERLLPFATAEPGLLAAISNQAEKPLLAALGYQPATGLLERCAAASLAAVVLRIADPGQLAAASRALRVGGVLVLECEPGDDADLGEWAEGIDQALVKCNLHVMCRALVAGTVTCLPDEDAQAATSAWCATKVALSGRDL